MPTTLQYTPLEKLTVARPVDRMLYVQSVCRGKTVLDLGAMDETAFQLKRGKGTWLHEQIGAVAAQVIGIDSSSLVPEAGLPTGARSAIYRGDVGNLPEVLAARAITPDVIVAGELIEHLPNPLAFLKSFRDAPALHGKTLLLTTPNATALHNCLIAVFQRESTHPDHLTILSYKTLTTLLTRAGFQDWELVPYYSRFTEMKERAQGFRKPLVGFCEGVINAAEWVAPLMSFGWVVRVTI